MTEARDHDEQRALRVARELAPRHGGSVFVYSNGASITIALGERARLSLDNDVLRLTVEGHPAKEKVKVSDPIAEMPAWVAELGARAYGWLAFDLARYYYDYPHDAGLPLCFVVPELEITFAAGEVRVEPERYRSEVDTALRGTFATSTAPRLSIDPTAEREVYAKRIERALERVRRRELEKVIVSRTQSLPGDLDVLSSYECALSNRAARRFCFRYGGFAGVGSCPEIVLVADPRGSFETNPLAGTKPRGATLAADELLCRELLEDLKEVREHAMSVRQVQSEVEELCAPDTFRIFRFMEVKKYPFTQHLSSRVGGRLSAGRTIWDAVRRVFPGVTVTGVEKSAAIRCIGELESAPRGIYGGAVGVVDPQGHLDLGIAIRSAFERNGRVFVSAGAGIVSESTLEDELVESENKMRTIAHALRGTSTEG